MEKLATYNASKLLLMIMLLHKNLNKVLQVFTSFQTFYSKIKPSTEVNKYTNYIKRHPFIEDDSTASFSPFILILKNTVSMSNFSKIIKDSI